MESQFSRGRCHAEFHTGLAGNQTVRPCRIQSGNAPLHAVEAFALRGCPLSEKDVARLTFNPDRRHQPAAVGEISRHLHAIVALTDRADLRLGVDQSRIVVPKQTGHTLGRLTDRVDLTGQPILGVHDNSPFHHDLALLRLNEHPVTVENNSRPCKPHREKQDDSSDQENPDKHSSSSASVSAVPSRSITHRPPTERVSRDR